MTAFKRQIAINTEDVGKAVTTLLAATPRPRAITLYPYGVIVNDDGTIGYNAFQQDGVVLEVEGAENV